MKSKRRLFQVRIQLSDDQVNGLIDRVMTAMQVAKVSNWPEDKLREHLILQFEELNFS